MLNQGLLDGLINSALRGDGIDQAKLASALFAISNKMFGIGEEIIGAPLDYDDVALKSKTNLFRGNNTFSVFPLNLEIGQLKFPATQNPSSDPNTQDDYEEGIWTPIIGGAGGTSGQTYSTQAGVYVKQSQLVVATFRCDLTAKGVITGAVQLKGLPFSCNGDYNVLYQNSLIWALTPGNWTNMQAQLTQVSGAVAPIFGVNTAATGFTALVTADIANTTILGGNIIYRAT